MDETIKYAKMNISLSEEMTSNYEYEEGNHFIGIHHVCTNDSFYRNAFGEERYKSIMNYRDNEICIDIINDSCTPNYKVNCGHYIYSKIYPLFNQSQLQEMLKPKLLIEHKNSLPIIKNKNPEGFINRMLIEKFNNFLVIYQDKLEFQKWIDYIVSFNSIEQLLLAHVMYELHNKIYKNNNWIENNEKISIVSKIYKHT